mgnify:CR=1 FL=1
MGLLVLGLAVFFSVHMLTSFRQARAVLIARYGEGTYKGVYSLAAGAGLAMVIWGMVVADTVPVWNPPAWGYRTALWAMPLAFVLLAASHGKNNLRRLTAHPMLWGVALWAGLHLLANGDLASLLLFGSFLVYSFYAMWAQNMRGAKPSGEVQPLARDVRTVLIGLIVAGVLAWGHRWFTGVALV